MRRLLVPLSLALILGSGIFVLATSLALPDRVASHFVPGGRANGWMPRETYLIFILTAAVLVPLVLVAMLAWLPRAFPRFVNLPNRDYWFEPDRRETTLAALSAFAWGFAGVISVLVAGLHRAVVDANASEPPVLQESTVYARRAAFTVAIGGWLLAWVLRFRRPR